MGIGYILDCHAADIDSVTEKLGAAIEIVGEYFDAPNIDTGKLAITPREGIAGSADEVCRLECMLMGYGQASAVSRIALDYLRQLEAALKELGATSYDILRQERERKALEAK